jgi:chromosome partitioning protein
MGRRREELASMSYSITQVAEMLGVHPRTIHRWESSGKVPPAPRDYKGDRLYSHDDLAQLRQFTKKDQPASGSSRRHIIAVVNQKGGVGKTTTSVNLGAALAKLGKRVLIVDLDPQGHATVGLGIDAFALKETVRDCLVDLKKPISSVIQPTSTKGLDLAPANILLSTAEREIPIVAQTIALSRALERVRDRYDYILIDCAPSLGLLTTNAFVASTGIIIPVEPEYYAMVGIQQILSSISMVRDTGIDTQIRGVLFTRYDARKSLTKEAEKTISSFFGKSVVLKTRIRSNVKLAEAPASGKTIFEYDPSSNGAADYLSVARELLAQERTKAVTA